MEDIEDPDKIIAKYRIAPDPSVLSGLSRVDWANLEHSYGSASDVPALLRALCSTNPGERDFALHDLFLKICHQGDVTTATVASVPFLFRLLDCPDTPEKGGIAGLLAAIGSRRGRTNTVDLEARGAVGVELALLFPYLRDPNPLVRERVARVLGDYREQGKECLAVLRGAGKMESDPDVCEVIEESVRKLEGSQG
jgi:hypothetical protein